MELFDRPRSSLGLLSLNCFVEDLLFLSGEVGGFLDLVGDLEKILVKFMGGRNSGTRAAVWYGSSLLYGFVSTSQNYNIL